MEEMVTYIGVAVECLLTALIIVGVIILAGAFITAHRLVTQLPKSKERRN